jgi:hypothetical protein
MYSNGVVASRTERMWSRRVNWVCTSSSWGEEGDLDGTNEMDVVGVAPVAESQVGIDHQAKSGEQEEEAEGGGQGESSNEAPDAVQAKRELHA